MDILQCFDTVGRLHPPTIQNTTYKFILIDTDTTAPFWLDKTKKTRSQIGTVRYTTEFLIKSVIYDLLSAKFM